MERERGVRMGQFSTAAFICLIAWCGRFHTGDAAAGTTVVHLVNLQQTAVCVHYWAPPQVNGGCIDLTARESGELSVTSPPWGNATMWADTGPCNASQSSCTIGPPSGVSQFEFNFWASGFDYYDVSAHAGFNMGVSVVPTNHSCPSASCTAPASCASNSVHTCPSGSSNYIVAFSRQCQAACAASA